MTNAEILDRTMTRLGDDPAAALGHYRRLEVLTAVNQVYRLQCFLTLCLETTVTFNLSAATAFYKMLNTYADWILPLRLRMVVSGLRLAPNRINELAALNSSWSATAGTAERYARLGFDFLCIYKQPADTPAVQIVYARTPTPLVDGSGEPETHSEYHQSLIDGAVPLLRIKEGAQEWQKTLESWNRFMDATQALGDYTRHRNRAQMYDALPFELARFDRSKLLMEVAK